MATRSEHRSPHARRNAIIALLVLIAIGVGAWAWSRTRTTGGASAGAAAGGGARGRRPAATVGVARATTADVPVTIALIGTVQPVVTATVRTQLAGTLFSLHFTEGQTVAKGDLLAEIDPRPYRLALQQAEANLARDQAQLNLAQVDLKRYQTLLSQDSIARQQVDTQAATVGQYAGTVGADRAAIGTAQLNLRYTSIVAPVAGKIGLRQADIGNYLTPSDTAGIAVITQTDPIDVSFSIPQAQLPALQARIASGGSVPASALDQTGARTLATGKFLTLDNQIDATTGTVKAKARFANGGGALFPSQFVNVSLLVDTLRQAVTVPVSAVRHGTSGDFVFVLQPDRSVKLRIVKTGPTLGQQIAILSGIVASDTVITEGADNLTDGSKVTLPGARGGRSAGADGAAAGAGRHRRRSGNDGGSAPE